MNDHVNGDSMCFTDALQLHRTLTAFTKLLPDEVGLATIQYSVPMALCYSALLHLYDPFCCADINRGANTVEETEMQSIAIEGVKSVAADVLQFSQVLRHSMTLNPAAASPLVGDALYMAATTFAWLTHETGSAEMAASYTYLKDSLQVLNGRWAVAGEYLKILEKTKDILYSNNPLL